jgi:hypothetical protein
MYVLWRACYLTAFTPCLTGPVDYPFASCHEEPRFNPHGVLMCNQDSPVSVVCYIGDPDVINVVASSKAGLVPNHH